MVRRDSSSLDDDEEEAAFPPLVLFVPEEEEAAPGPALFVPDEEEEEEAVPAALLFAPDAPCDEDPEWPLSYEFPPFFAHTAYDGAGDGGATAPAPEAESVLAVGCRMGECVGLPTGWRVGTAPSSPPLLSSPAVPPPLSEMSAASSSLVSPSDADHAPLCEVECDVLCVPQSGHGSHSHVPHWLNSV